MSSTIAQHGLVDLDAEIANTRRVLERVPADHLEFTPHAKSWPLRRVAKHLTDFGGWGSYTLQSDGIDFAQPFPPGPPDPTDAAGFLKLFDEGMDGFKAALATATDEQMLATWTIRNGDVVLSTQSRAATLRSMVMNHMIHHRAQLTIYLRLLGVPVPGLYGPSADEGGN